jgi:alpha/beta superfamily hydrolase
MNEEPVKIQTNDQIILDGRLSRGSTGQGVVITHPHPLYGGDMHNIVVETIARAFQGKGNATLRFNFRGVGRSTGAYDDGNGEQEDVLAAVDFLSEMGIQKIDLAGYSFGTWVIARMIRRLAPDVPVDSVIMVSPPAAMMPFDDDISIPQLTLAVTGSADEFAPPGLIEDLVRKWHPAAGFEVIDGADHFFFGYTDKLLKMIQKNIPHRQ